MTVPEPATLKSIVPPWTLAAVPLLAVFAPKAMVVLLALVALPSLYQAWQRRELTDVFPRHAVILAAVAFAWMLLRAAFPFDGHHSVTDLLKFAVLAILGFGAVWWVRSFSSEERAVAGKSLLYGTVLALIATGVLGLAIHFDAVSFIANDRTDRLSIFNTGLIVITVLAPILYLHGVRLWRRRWAYALLAVIAGTTFFIGSMTAIGALLIGAVVSLLTQRLGRPVVQLIAVLCVAVIVAFPVVVPLVMDRIDVTLEAGGEQKKFADGNDALGSLGHRYYIWRFALEKARERPLIGWGFDTSRDLPGGHGHVGWGKELMPLHPHNAILQSWVELGVPGLLIFGAMLWMFLRAPPEDRALVQGGLAARTAMLVMMFAVLNATFGIWQSWWVASLALLLAISYLTERPTAKP